MLVVIEYDSCWQTGFLSDDPNKPIDYSKRGKTNFHADNGFSQKFVATSGTRGEKSIPLSDMTILGVLSRLIGDQRKLFQAKRSDNYYFADIEDKITWQLKNDIASDELAYITNKSDSRCGQGSWLGIISDDNPWFYSDLAPLLWSVLYLDRIQILDFILSDAVNQSITTENVDCRPTALLAKLNIITDAKTELGIPWLSLEQANIEKGKLEKKLQEELDKRVGYLVKSEVKPPKTEGQKVAHSSKLLAFERKIGDINNDIDALKQVTETQKLNSVIQFLAQKNPDNQYMTDGKLYPFRLYAAALYLQAERLIQSGRNLDFVLNKDSKIQIQGFSKRGFNGVRDWLNPMAGGRKKTVGTPCEIKKHTGQLEINLDIERDRAIRLKEMIDCAGVSAFYLGKKGLAYVSEIHV